MSQQNMAMVLQALKNAGLSDNQARILGAEIGRENAFQDKYLWGYHTDPANKKKNIGIISWQGTRADGVERALKAAGLIQNGKIVKGQASLDVMAKYLVNEMRTNPEYAQTKKQFLDNPNVDYKTATRALDTNFIRWRYDDPNYASGHKNRENFYRKLGGVAPVGGTMSAQSTTPQTDPMANFQPEQPQVQDLLNNYKNAATQLRSYMVEPPNNTSDLLGVSYTGGGFNFDLLTQLENSNQHRDLERLIPLFAS